MKTKLSIAACIAATLLWCASALAAIPITWRSNALSYKGAIGQVFTFACPGGGRPGKSLYGTGTYTVDSGICVAAVHSGLISFNGGLVKIRITPGMGKYFGTFRNGIKSTGWGRYHTSFVFLRSGPRMITWNTNVVRYKGQIGKVLSFRCPPGGRLTKTIYGTGTYTIDSGVCVAAVHIGKLTPNGGVVRIKIIQGLPKYFGSPRNGVTSRSWNSYHTSFIFL